jgi:hypothetical protein
MLEGPAASSPQSPARCRPAGSTNDIAAPFADPLKMPCLHPGSAPFWGQRWSRLFFSQRAQVLPQRGHGLRSQLPHQTRLPAAAGSMMAPMAPASAPSKVCDLQEKSTTAEGADVFGCADELEWRAFADTRSTATTGAWRSPTYGAASREGVPARGVTQSPSWSPSWSQEDADLQGKWRKVRGSVLVGGSNGLVCLSPFRRCSSCPRRARRTSTWRSAAGAPGSQERSGNGVRARSFGNLRREPV